ncbi:hypothetical protein ACVW1C_000860 [Bradyrhizobium sp. USDA 4011]
MSAAEIDALDYDFPRNPRDPASNGATRPIADRSLTEAHARASNDCYRAYDAMVHAVCATPLSRARRNALAFTRPVRRRAVGLCDDPRIISPACALVPRDDHEAGASPMGCC